MGIYERIYAGADLAFMDGIVVDRRVQCRLGQEPCSRVPPSFLRAIAYLNQAFDVVCRRSFADDIRFTLLPQHAAKTLQFLPAAISLLCRSVSGNHCVEEVPPYATLAKPIGTCCEATSMSPTMGQMEPNCDLSDVGCGSLATCQVCRARS